MLINSMCQAAEIKEWFLLIPLVAGCRSPHKKLNWSPHIRRVNDTKQQSPPHYISPFRQPNKATKEDDEQDRSV